MPGDPADMMAALGKREVKVPGAAVLSEPAVKAALPDSASMTGIQSCTRILYL